MTFPFILRSAINAVRRNHQVKLASLNTMADTQLSSFSTTRIITSCNMGNGFELSSSSCASNLDLNHPSSVVSPINIKTTLAHMIANISRDSALIVTDFTQTSLSETESNESIMNITASKLEELSVWLISTLKRRKKMMNKHKLRKRRKKLRLKSKK